MTQNENTLLYNLHFCLRSLVTYIQASRTPVLWFPDNQTPVTELTDFKLSLKTLEEATLALLDIKTKLGSEFVNACSKPNEI
jgi:hypothetical protein